VFYSRNVVALAIVFSTMVQCHPFKLLPWHIFQKSIYNVVKMAIPEEADVRLEASSIVLHE
jgi:hypothetical protein